jgi:hypothetical protein
MCDIAQRACLKCLSFDSHFEWKCPLYSRFSKYKCSNCHAGFHWAVDCQNHDQKRSRSKSPSNSQNPKNYLKSNY